MLKREWQSIWKDKKLTLSIIVMFFMPLLYAGMLLYAFWDPYNRLDELPVAIVNEDKGAQLEGEPLQLGDELVSELLDNKDLNFIEIDAEKANEGLLNEDYYLLIRVPENFSEHATTLLDENPKKLELEYYANEGSNFLSAQIGGNAIEKIRTKVNEQVAKTYATELYDAIAKLGEGFIDASDAATKIQEGLDEVASGSVELKEYLYQLASSTVTLSNGTNTLNKGIQDASQGAKQLAGGIQDLNNGASQLQEGMNSAATGAANVAKGVTDYTNGVAELSQGQEKVAQGQEQFQQGVSSIAANSTKINEGAASLQAGSNEVAQGLTALQQQLQAITATLPEEQAAQLNASVAALVAGSKSVSDGASTLASSTNQFQQGVASLQQNGAELLSGQQQVVQGLQQLQQNSAQLVEGAKSLQAGNETLAAKMGELTTGSEKLVAGVSTLNNGLDQISNGSKDLTAGTNELASKSGELAEGSQALVEGSAKLKDGSGELASSLKDAGKEAEMNTTDEQIDMTVSPVELKETVYNEVDNYGVGFAPYFISLGLFVGSLLLTNVYPYVQPAGHPTGLWSWFSSKSSVIVIVGFFQMVMTYVLMKFGLGIQVEHEWWLIATIVITSFAFLALVQMFTVVLGDVGRFFALIFLVIQLAGSAGTFPVELLPIPLQNIHNFLPMSYSVHAFRAAISTNDSSVLTHSLTVLGIIGVVSVAISFAFFALLYKRRYSKVQEA